MQQLIMTLIDGINLGSVYALVALGYTMVYGIAKMLNFAHGDIIMVGAYTIVVFITRLSVSVPLAMVLCVAFCAVLGFVIEKLAYKPLRHATPLGFSSRQSGSVICFRICAPLIRRNRQFIVKFIDVGSFDLFGVSVSGISVIIWVTTIVIMLGLYTFIKRQYSDARCWLCLKTRAPHSLLVSMSTAPSLSPLLSVQPSPALPAFFIRQNT